MPPPKQTEEGHLNLGYEHTHYGLHYSLAVQ